MFLNVFFHVLARLSICGRNGNCSSIPNMFLQRSKVNNLECELLLLRFNLFSQKAINSLFSLTRHLSHQKNAWTINPSAKYRKNTSEDQPTISVTLVGYRARDVSVLSFNSMTGGRAQCFFPLDIIVRPVCLKNWNESHLQNWCWTALFSMK
jgi:hypothetical protein